MGCSISVASASILAEVVTGESVAHARETFEAMRAMLTSKGEDPGDEELLGDASPSPASRSTPPASSAPCWLDGAARTPCTRPAQEPRSDRDHHSPPHVADVEEALRDVVDPELGINVVDLGLVYGITVDDQNARRHRHDADLRGLPADRRHRGPDRAALEGLVDDFRINWVWMPPWGPDKITDDGREQLRALGFNV